MLFYPDSSSSSLLASSSSSSSLPAALLSLAAFFFSSSRWATVYLVALVGLRVVALAPPLALLAKLEVRFTVVVEFAAAPLAGLLTVVPVVVVLPIGRLAAVVVLAFAAGLLAVAAFAVVVVAFWCKSVVGLLTVPLFAVAAAVVLDGLAFDLPLLLSIFLVLKILK